MHTETAPLFINYYLRELMTYISVVFSYFLLVLAKLKKNAYEKTITRLWFAISRKPC